MTQLSQYLNKNKITQVEFASLINTTQATVSRLAVGKAEPSPRLALKIQEVTDGAVPFECWYRSEDSAA
jgi:predicted XRE-type DNA-binding protein